MKNCFRTFYKRIYCLLHWHLCRYKSFRSNNIHTHTHLHTQSMGKDFIYFEMKKRHMHACQSFLITLSLHLSRSLFDLFRHFSLTIAFVFDCWFCYLTEPIYNNRRRKKEYIPAITLLD